MVSDSPKPDAVNLVRRSLRTLGIGCAVFLATLQVAAAQNDTDQFVTRNFYGTDVLRVDCKLDVSTSTSFGVAKITIANPKRKSPADRDLSVVFYLKSWGTSHDGFAYQVPVRLAEGQRQTTVEVPFSYSGGQCAWDVGVFEGGRDIEDKRGQNRNRMAFQWMYDQSNHIGHAAIRGADQSLNRIQDTLQHMNEVIYPTANKARPVISTQVLTLAELNTDWRYYLPYSVWTLSAPTLREINAKRPAIAQALKNYVAAGGTILVYDASEVEDTQQVEQLLGGSGQGLLGGSRWTSEKSSKGQWWWQDLGELPDVEPQGEDTPPPSEMSRAGVTYDVALAAETWMQAGLGNHLKNVAELSTLLGGDELDVGGRSVQFTLRSYRYDLFEALGTEEVLRFSFLGGQVLLTSKSIEEIPDDLLRKTLRAAEGKSASSLAATAVDGNWFWRNLITTVGKPPVWTFCGIVGLFGALLGPGLLYLTGRMGRRSLMILLVPVISLAATLAIILYGILYEGFDTHVRVMSISRIDAAADTGFCWSRQNYFSGLPPREGISFRKETFVRPVHADSDDRYSGIAPRQAVSYRIALTDRQIWRGWLKARQQQQLLVGHPLQSPALPLKVTQASEGGLQVTNVSGDPLPFVVLRGGQDDYYFVEEMAPEQTVVLAAETKEEAGSNVARVMVDYRPVPPPELQDGGSLLSFGSRSRRSRNDPNTALDDVLNVTMREYLSERLNMRPFSYATVVKDNDLVEVPLDGKQSEGLHIVIGVDAW